MLWQDGEPSKDPADVLQEAISYYQTKYNQTVTHIQAPLDFPKVGKIDGVLLSRKRSVQNGHIMLAHHDDGQSVAGANGGSE
jgi:hypothetical protein